MQLVNDKKLLLFDVNFGKPRESINKLLYNPIQILPLIVQEFAMIKLLHWKMYIRTGNSFSNNIVL